MTDRSNDSQLNLAAELTAEPAQIYARGAVIHDRRVLLLRTLLDGHVRYFLPGGKQEPGETLEETVRRELCEEATIRVTVGQLAWHRRYEHGPEHRIEYTYLCSARSDPDAAELGTQTHPSHQAVEWVALDDLHGIDLRPESLAARLRTID